MKSEQLLHEAREPHTPESIRLRRIGAASASIALGLALSACSSGENAAPPTVYVTSTVTASPSPMASEQQPLGNSCQARQLEDNRHREQEAKKCLDIRTLSHVALVNYSYTKDEAELLAHSTELNIDEASHGVINADIEVIEPTKAARAANDHYIKNGCRTESSDMETSPSYIADSMMPSLEKYDIVIGVTDAQKCDAPNTTGYAWAGTGRYAEILTAKSGSERPVDAAITGAHEGLHLEGIGHDSTLVSHDVQLSDWEPKDAHDRRFSLADYITTSDYHEYTSGTQMGSKSSIIVEPFNAPQRYLSEWPLRELNKPTSIEPYDLRLQHVEFNTSSESDSIAIMDLDEPLIIEKPTEDNPKMIETLTVRQIAFAPHYERRGQRYNPVISLIAESGNVISLGSFKTADKDVTTDVVVGKQRIQVTTNASTETSQVELIPTP